MTIRPSFLFTKNFNSFTVKVENLEKLSIKQIQKIETFVSFRNGIFDFNSYSFSINKIMSFNEFTTLIKLLNIDATCKEDIKIVHNYPRIYFGQYKGMEYKELPLEYLVWLKNNYFGKDKTIIKDEILSRTTSF